MLACGNRRLLALVRFRSETLLWFPRALRGFLSRTTVASTFSPLMIKICRAKNLLFQSLSAAGLLVDRVCARQVWCAALEHDWLLHTITMNEGCPHCALLPLMNQQGCDVLWIRGGIKSRNIQKISTYLLCDSRDHGTRGMSWQLMRPVCKASANVPQTSTAR